MKGIVGITGTPGTGKKSIAPLVAESLKIPYLSLNGLAASRGLVDEDGSVDTARLKRALKSSVSGQAVVYGHLLPFAVEESRLWRAVVLRCDPTVLKERLRSRGYPEDKVLENVEAELIGALAAESYKAFGRRTVEFDTTGMSAADSSARVLKLLRGASGGPQVEWMTSYDTGPKLRSLLPSP